MLVLCSNGLSSEAVLTRLRPCVPCGGRAALVVTADPDYRERNYHVPRCVSELEALGLTVDSFDLDRQPAAQLLDYDAVEFIGGNPYYLLHAIRKSHAEATLRILAARRILIGWSAAAFVFSPTLALVDLYSPEMNTVGLTDMRGLALSEVQVLPHYSRFLERFDRFEEKCRRYEQAQHVQVIRINDGDAVFVDSEVHVCRA